MDEKGFKTIDDFIGLAAKNYVDWGDLDLNHKVIANINEEKCVECQLCYIACWDGAHQSIAIPDNGSRVPYVVEELCVGCNLCSLICPVPECIEMVKVDSNKPTISWREYQAQLAANKG